MRTAVFAKKETPSSTRIAVDRAITLSKERDAKWEDGKKLTAAQSEQDAEHSDTSHAVACRNEHRQP